MVLLFHTLQLLGAADWHGFDSKCMYWTVMAFNSECILAEYESFVTVCCVQRPFEFHCPSGLCLCNQLAGLSCGASTLSHRQPQGPLCWLFFITPPLPRYKHVDETYITWLCEEEKGLQSELFQNAGIVSGRDQGADYRPAYTHSLSVTRMCINPRLCSFLRPHPRSCAVPWASFRQALGGAG